MMTGTVNAVLEATLPLQVYGPAVDTMITAVIDTGYNGALSLPLATVNRLSLRLLVSRRVVLGDASSRVLDLYEAAVLWNGQRRSIQVLCVEGDPLIGTGLLQGHKMEADFVIGGQVQITAVP